MPKTQINGGDRIADGTLTRTKVNTTTAGSALVAKVIAGTGVTLASTGADAGTGDVTVNAAVRYDFIVSASGLPGAGERLLDHVAAVAFTVPSALAGSQSTNRTTAAASAAFTLKKNGTSFGTITFAAGSTTGTLAAASATVFAVGDRLELAAPTTQDTTLADLSFTVVATR